MIKLIVEITELKNDASATHITFRIAEENPTTSESFWAGRLYPVLKDALNIRGLLGERGLAVEYENRPKPPSASSE